jgi:hypothetical protein
VLAAGAGTLIAGLVAGQVDSRHPPLACIPAGAMALMMSLASSLSSR